MEFPFIPRSAIQCRGTRAIRRSDSGKWSHNFDPKIRASSIGSDTHDLAKDGFPGPPLKKPMWIDAVRRRSDFGRTSGEQAEVEDCTLARVRSAVEARPLAQKVFLVGICSLGKHSIRHRDSAVCLSVYKNTIFLRNCDFPSQIAHLVDCGTLFHVYISNVSSKKHSAAPLIDWSHLPVRGVGQIQIAGNANYRKYRVDAPTVTPFSSHE